MQSQARRPAPGGLNLVDTLDLPSATIPEPLAGLVADTSVGLARSIVALHQDEALNRACTEAALAYVAERLSEERVDALIRRAVDPTA